MTTSLFSQRNKIKAKHLRCQAAITLCSTQQQRVATFSFVHPIIGRARLFVCLLTFFFFTNWKKRSPDTSLILPWSYRWAWIRGSYYSLPQDGGCKYHEYFFVVACFVVNAVVCFVFGKLNFTVLMQSDCGLTNWQVYRNDGKDLAGALALSCPSVQLCVWYSELMCSVWSRREDKPECPGQG